MHLPVPSVAGWMHRAFVLRMQVESAIDLLLHAKYPSADISGTIVLYNEVDAGFGDISFANKLLKLLRREFPGFEIILASTNLPKHDKFGRPEAVTVMSVEDFAALPNHRHPDLVISAPGNFDHCRSADEVRTALGVDPSTPFIYLAEYGSLRYLRNDAMKDLVKPLEHFLEVYLDELAEKTGYPSDELGHKASTGDIFHIPEDGTPNRIGHILDGLISLRQDNPLRVWLAEPLIAFRACGIDIGEIGIHIDEDLYRESQTMTSPEIRRAKFEELEHTHLKSVLSETFGTSALYAGYANSGYDTFLDYVSILENSHTRDIDFVIPSARTPQMLHDAFMTEGLRGRLLGRGISRVLFIGYDEAGYTVTDPRPTTVVHDLADAGKTLRVISYFPLPHRDMRRLLLLSEAPTVVSGDQSFSDAVSADKAILYVEPVYCQAYHVDAVLALTGRIAPEMQTVLRFGARSVWSDEGYGEIVSLLSSPETGARDADADPDFSPPWSGGPQPPHAEVGSDGGALAPFFHFNAILREQHNANVPLVAAVKRSLLTHGRPEVLAEVRTLIESGLMNFSAALGWPLPL